MKWYNFETRFLSYGIYYELSGAYSFYHFEIKTDDDGARKINDFIDAQAITEN